MRYFSMPADFKMETIDAYEKLNHEYDKSRIVETYGNITVGEFFESGRSVNMLPRVGLHRFREYVQYSLEKGIGFNYTLNAAHMNNKEFTRRGLLEILNFLDKLNQIGVRAVTITLPSLTMLVKRLDYDFEIVTSTICTIADANKARAYEKMGVDRIVVDESVNRKFGNLRRICAAVETSVETIINAVCHKNCAFRTFHYNQIASDSIEVVNDASANFYSHQCVLQRFDKVSNLLRLSWIRPEDLKHYEQCGVTYFKVQGRHTALHGDPVRAAEAYFKESFDGNLMELLDLFAPTNQFKVYIDNKKLDGFLEAYIRNENFCRNDCTNCNYCEIFARKCIDYKEAEAVIAAAVKFYGECDQFNIMVDSLTTSSIKNEEQAIDMTMTADFDL